MKKNKIVAIMVALIICILVLPLAVSCDGEPKKTTTSTPPTEASPTAPDTSDKTPADDPTDKPQDMQTPETQDTPPPYPGPDVALVPYDGVVEHIFFHEVIAYPGLAFDGDAEQQGYDTNMVTVYEFNRILESLYRKNFILVNMNDVWSEYKDENGVWAMKKNTLMLPEGKKPIIISFDDITFYKYMSDDGFMHKYYIGEDGDIWASGVDPDGKAVVSQDLAAIPILDKFVREHPDFSLFGVKGCIALTGYEGILGYRTHTDVNDTSEEFRINRMHEIARVQPVIERLKETGWYFASHSYGHIGINTAAFDRVKADALRWMDEVGSLVGETKIFIYPFGARLDGGDVYDTGPAFLFYHDELGFRLFASVGYEPFSRIKPDISAVVCDRMNVDGTSLRENRERYLRFYDATEVFDPMRPSEYGKDW